MSTIKLIGIDPAPSLSVNSGITTFYDTTVSINSLVGSVILNGGLSISNTTDSTSFTSGGSMSVAGGFALNKSLYVGGSSYLQSINSGTWNANTILVNKGGTGTTFFSQNSLLLGNGTNPISSSGITYTSNVLTLDNLTSIVIQNTTDATSSTGTFSTSGGAIIKKSLYVNGSAVVNNIIIPATFAVDSITLASRTAPFYASVNISSATLTSINSNVTTTTASTLYIAGPPVAGQNQTITNSYSLLIKSGVIFSSDTTVSSNSNSGSVVLSGGLSISNTTNSTSTISGGSFTTSGGISVAKDIWLGGVLYSSSASFPAYKIANTVSGSESSIGFYKNSDFSVSSAGDFWSIGQNVGSSGPGYFAVSTYLTGKVLSFSSSGLATFYNTIDSVSSATGSVVISGGLAVSKNIYSGSGINATAFYANSVSSTYNSIIQGTNSGISWRWDISGVSGNGLLANQDSGIYTTGVLNNYSIIFKQNGVIYIPTSIDATSAFAGGLTLVGGASIAKSLYVGLGINSPILTLTSTLASALTTSGGILLLNTSDATNSTNGGTITTAGGAAIAKSLFVGNLLQFTNSIPSRKIVLYDISGNNNEYIGLGVDSGIMRFNVDSVTSNFSFYAGTGSGSSNSVFTVLGSGNVYLNSGSFGIGTTTNINSSLTFSPNSSIGLSTLAGSDTGFLQMYGSGTSTNGAGLILYGNNSSSFPGNFVLTSIGAGKISFVSAGAEQFRLNSSGIIEITNTTDAISRSAASLVIDGGIAVSKTIYLGASVQAYTLGSRQTSDNTLLLSGKTSGAVSQLALISADQTNTSNVSFVAYGFGGNTLVNTESILVGYNSSTTAYSIQTSSSGTGTTRALSMYTGNNIGQIVANPDGSVSFNSTVISSSSSIGSVKILGGISLQNTTDASGSTTGGTLTTSGGMAIAKSLYIGSNLVQSSTSASFLISGTTNSRFLVNSSLINFAPGGGSTTISMSSSLTTILSPTIFSLNSASTSYATGSVVVSGGLAISSTINSVNSTNGGALTVGGGVAIAGDLYTSMGIFMKPDQNLYVGGLNFKGLSSGNGVILFGDGSGKSLFFKRSTDSAVLASLSDTGVFSVMYPITSTSGNVGSIVASSIGIAGTQNSLSSANGGSFTIAGGAGIAKDAYVGGNLVITGNLTVNGTVTSINSTVTNINDNLVVNTAPAGSRDAGLLAARFQQPNDSGFGDIVSDVPAEAYFLTTQSGATSVQLILPNSANAADSYYVNWWIKMTSGLNINMCRQVTNYIGATRTLTLLTPWTSQNPVAGDYIALYNRVYSGIIYQESTKNFITMFTASNPSNPSIVISAYGNLEVGSLITHTNLNITGSNASTNANTGALTLLGGIGIQSTFDSQNSSNGGGITIAGGAAIGKRLFVGSSASIGTNNFSGAPLHIGYSNGTDQIQLENTLGTATSKFYVDSLNNLILSNTDSSSGNIYINPNKSVIISGNSTPSSSSTTGDLLLSGGISVSNTSDALTSSSGGTFTTSGGAAIGKKLFVGTQSSFGTNNSGYPIRVGYANSQIFLERSDLSDIFSPRIGVQANNQMSFTNRSTDSGFLFVTNGSSNTATDNGLNVAPFAQNGQYTNAIRMFTYNNSLSASSYEALRIENVSGAGYSIFTDSLGSGTSRSLSMYTKGNVNQLVLGTDGSVNIGTNIIVNGTGNSTSNTSGGSFTTQGGLAVAKDAYIGGNLYVSGKTVSIGSGDILDTFFSISSGVSTATNITGFNFSNNIRAFSSLVSVVINATASTFSVFQVYGIQNATGWSLTQMYEGDSSGITFFISSSGQVQYTSSTYPGFISGNLHFRAQSLSV